MCLLSGHTSKPIINALTDFEHPCQALADFLTIKEEFGELKDVVFTFIGDGNNVANSLIFTAALLDVEIRIACPNGYEPDPIVVKKAREISNNSNKLTITHNPQIAATGADVLYTDVWSSMGEENLKENKDKDFNGFCINSSLINKANNNVIVMHCRLVDLEHLVKK